jgi:hypothetical protein
MTLVDLGYLAEIIGRLRDDGHDVRHFALLADRPFPSGRTPTGRCAVRCAVSRRPSGTSDSIRPEPVERA